MPVSEIVRSTAKKLNAWIDFNEALHTGSLAQDLGSSLISGKIANAVSK